jgi:hypothetical protein
MTWSQVGSAAQVSPLCLFLFFCTLSNSLLVASWNSRLKSARSAQGQTADGCSFSSSRRWLETICRRRTFFKDDNINWSECSIDVFGCSPPPSRGCRRIRIASTHGARTTMETRRCPLLVRRRSGANPRARLYRFLLFWMLRPMHVRRSVNLPFFSSSLF